MSQQAESDIFVTNNIPAGVLLVARKRGFWSRPEAQGMFQRRIMLEAEPSKSAYLFAFSRTIAAANGNKTRAILFGTSTPVLSWFCRWKRRGFFKRVKIIADHQYLVT